MKLFRVDVPIFATAYIQADTAEDALALVKTLSLTGIEVPASPDVSVSDDLILTNRRFDDADLPELSLSPAMTFGSFQGLSVNDIEDTEEE